MTQIGLRLVIFLDLFALFIRSKVAEYARKQNEISLSKQSFRERRKGTKTQEN